MTSSEYTRIVTWLYTSDGMYVDKNEWRTKFLKFLSDLIGEEDVGEKQKEEKEEQRRDKRVKILIDLGVAREDVNPMFAGYLSEERFERHLLQTKEKLDKK
ncbi:hypothetical protein LCGC14_1269250 [marine sediment metagenome]|uniref:Uncharacterized protein n=1 Tax=marine sediment metagenome TaxID=412755 RepID=A0A0F9LJK9_9ZZZZ|nr:hypothetical protein [bacterium]